MERGPSSAGAHTQAQESAPLLARRPRSRRRLRFLGLAALVRAGWSGQLRLLGLLGLVGLLQIGPWMPGDADAHGGGYQRIDELSGQISADPSNARLYAERAAILRNNERFDEALRDYGEAIRLSPTSAEYRTQRAQALREAGRLGEGLAVVDALLGERPQELDALLVRARIHAEMGAHDEAIRDFRNVLNLSPQPSPDLFLECAEALASSGNSADAVGILDRGIATLGPMTMIERRAIAFEVELGRFDSALARTNHLMSLAQRKDRWLMQRGEILEAAGRRDEAMVAYQEALDSLGQLPQRLNALPAARELAAELQRRLQPMTE